MICRRKLVNRTMHLHWFNLISVNLSAGETGKRYMGHSVDSSSNSINNNNTSIDKLLLASSLACVVDESSQIDERKPMNRLELKRFLELRVKKRVKDQFKDGKFHDLIEKVIANPYTLQDAYDSIRVNSNVNLASECDNIDFTSLAKELAFEKFDISSNIYSFSTRGENKEKLIIPNLKTNVIQEAIRIALEVVYRPHFSKISHGCRTGRGQSSALKYICKEIVNPDWWFPIILNKKIHTRILSKLISTMETKIEDPKLYSLIHSMFNVGVLNLEFGGFAKGHGLPQEGLLSPVLMNIYLDLFDREILNLSMKYEVLDALDDGQFDESKSESKLRRWFRRQMSPTQGNEGSRSGVRVHCCRLMDEILIIVKGSKEVSLALKSEIETYIQGSLYLDFDSNTNILQCNDPRGVNFTGNIIKTTVKESPAVRAVHKLKEKVELFALQKEEAWNEGMIRIGKKVLGHGFKKVKESEIKHLANRSSVLSHVSCFRKPGMETDHWYKVLLKVWMQGQNLKRHDTEEYILSKLITEKALPENLKDSFYMFQNQVKKYVKSETKSTVNLLPESAISSESGYVTEVSSPLKAIRMCLHRYGITNREGYPRACQTLVLLDHDNIIDWYNGIVTRWVKWYHLCENFGEIKIIISEKVWKSCIRTLATKYRLHETEIERKFESDLCRISLTEEDSVNGFLESRDLCYDEGLLYGVGYSGLCMLSLARVVSKSRPCTCFVIGCREAAPCVYTVHVMQRQKFPVWKTGFSSFVHPSLHRRRVGLCKQHLKDLFVGQISLQSVCFDDWK
ncbi:nuclear intron maturase 4, mitochondrial-like [Bidens hawaiensis]|uniref:nuclear intron maturase 4, mitochondrial-like n=1 Tax=Bidens hawaiensis TaxID=980011 RepID=UPI00404BA1BE